ncbi:MAG: amino acid adenylation domain-containing protein [Bryobacterales bacterium]|nr:amino acid adenylation domain-containing protein [Bryobacterales bacterium]
MSQQPVNSLVDYLEASAARFPGRPAVVGPDERTLSYSELNVGADRLAAFLARRGVKPGDRVGLLLPKSIEAVAAVWSIMKARAAYVPIDWKSPAARARSILTDCDTRAVFVDFSVLETAAGCEPARDTLIVLNAPDGAELPANTVRWEEAAAAPATAPLAGRDRGELAYILYTSGSTGVPKGVMLSHANALSFVDWCSDEFHPHEDDRFSNHAPFHFDLSVLDLYVPVKHGASVHLIDDETGKSPKHLAAFIERRKITIWYSTPSILHLLASLGNLRQGDFSSLRIVLFAGEVFPVKHLRELKSIWSWPVYYNLYGPTETNVCSFARIPDGIPEDRTEPYPIGWTCSHCRPIVLDAGQKPVAAGEEGMLYIAGESVFQGYWNRPEQQAAAFLTIEGERWYCTGDVVVEDPECGYIYVGRRDRMVKRRGFRIELDEIECALYRHPRVREAAVVASTTGGEVRIAAYLSADAEPPPGVLEMKMFCGKNLPSYMNPDVFTFLDALPRTSTNKVDYRGLAQRLQSAAARTA